MGCGSSSLKGEKGPDLAADTMPAAKKVRTNFSDVDFTTGATADRRGTTAVAPDEEHRRPTRVSEASVEMPGAPPAKSETTHDGATLEPYKTIDGDDALNEPNMTTPKVQHTTELPTDVYASNEESAAFATTGTSNSNPIHVN